MKKLLALTTAGLVVLSAIAAAPPVFQMRLVLDAPSADTEKMICVTRYHGFDSTNIYNVQKTVLLDQTALKSVEATNDALGQPIIDINLTDSGAKQFAQVTRQNIDKKLAIIVAGKVRSAPVIRQEITGGQAQISGSFTKQETEELAKKMNDALVKK